MSMIDARRLKEVDSWQSRDRTIQCCRCKVRSDTAFIVALGPNVPILYPLQDQWATVQEMGMSNASRLTRGRVAALAGCNLETVRYYERVGLMPAPPRSKGGHRVYDQDLLRRLNFIRRCRELGLTLVEIRGLLELVDGGTYTCGEVKDMTEAHLRSVQSRMADLRRLEKTLKEMVSKCVGDQVPECPVIDVLFRDEARPPNRDRSRFSPQEP